MAISTNGTVLARVAGALYKTQMSNATYSEVKALDPATLVDTLYARDFASMSDLSIATTLVTNLGLSTVAGLNTWVAAQLTAAGSHKGAKIVDLLNGFAQMTADATYGAAATAFNTVVDAALVLSQTTGNAGGTFAAAGVAVIPNATFTLTTGIDALTGTAGNDTFNATSVLLLPALSALDNINGAAGADTLNVTDSNAISVPASVTVANIETANFTGGSTITANVSGWTGLTKVTSTSLGGATMTAAATTAVTVADTTGAASVTGGLSQTVTAAGGLTLSGSVGAIVATDSAQAAAVTAINGGTDVTLTSGGITAYTGTITVGGTTAPTGAIAVTATDAYVASGTGGIITTTGGTSSTVTQNITSTTAASTITVTGGAVNVNGGAATTSASVTQSAKVTAAAAVTVVAQAKATGATTNGDITTAAVAAVAALSGVTDGAVTIRDATAIASTAATVAGTLATVTLNNYGDSTISSNALSTLNLSGTAGTLGITTGLTTPVNTTLALNVNGLSGANTITDSTAFAGAGYKTLNVATATANSTIAQIAADDATALNVSGTKTLTLTSAIGMTTLATVAVTGAAGLNATLTQATVTDINASASTGSNTITLTSTQTTYEGGSGVDTVTIGAVSTKVIDGGAGAADVLVVNAASYATNPTKNINFETLKMGASASGAFDANGFTGLSAAAITGNSSFTNVGAGVGLTLTGATGFVETVTLLNATGTSDVFNLKVSAGASVTNSVDVAGVETVNISLVDSATAGHVTTLQSLTVTDAAATAINVTGTGGMNLALTAVSTALTSVDASGMTGAGFVWASGNLAAAATIKGSVANTNGVDFSLAATAIVTYIGGSGNDNVVLSTAGKANVLTLGDGANVVTGATTGANTITGGANADTFTTALGGNNVINFGNGANAFTATTGNNTYTGGTGVDTVSVGGGMNVLTLGTGADVVTFSALTANGNTYSTIVDAHATMTINLAAVDTVAWRDLATFSKVATLAGTAVFQDYLNAASVGDGTLALSGGNSVQADATGGGAIAKYFNYSGDTYIVIDNSASTSFVNGADFVVKLTGIVDLSTATHATSIITLF